VQVRKGQGRVHAADVDELEFAPFDEIGKPDLAHDSRGLACEPLSGDQRNINLEGISVGVVEAPVQPKKRRNE